jgi:membrane fusion protein (multidrug efflux system)
MLRKTLLALAIASALVACGKSAKEPEKAGASASASATAGKDEKKEPMVTLQMSPEDILTVESNALASGPVITGSIQPERRADLRAEVGAVVLQVLKENGEPVRKGDVLLRLDETSIRDSVNSAEEATRAAEQTLAQAQRMYERQKTLLASGMVSTQAQEDAEIRRNNAQSDLAAAKIAFGLGAPATDPHRGARAVRRHRQRAQSVQRRYRAGRQGTDQGDRSGQHAV